MEAINPVGMNGSLEPPASQIGNIDFNTKTIGFLGDDEKKELMKSVFNYKLSEHVKCFINEYDKIFGERDIFLWKWLGPVYRDSGAMLSCVNGKYVNSITDDKIILTMIAVILDDTADIDKNKDLLDAMFETLRLGDVRKEFKDNKKICFLNKLWNFLVGNLEKYPNYSAYRDIFMYDFRQLLNCIDYSCLVNNELNMLNTAEVGNYDSHNMIVFLLNGIDLMASPSFDTRDLPHMRKAFWHAQQMARIGNWLSTWKREVKEKDFCSGVFAYAFEKKVINANGIETLLPEEIIERIEQSGMKQYFLKIWAKNYQQLESLKQSIHSVDMYQYIHGLENVIKYHIASEGLK